MYVFEKWIQIVSPLEQQINRMDHVQHRRILTSNQSLEFVAMDLWVSLCQCNRP